MSDKLKTFSHMSHGLGDHATGHAVAGNIARDGAPKKVSPVAVHDGIEHQLPKKPDGSAPRSRDSEDGIHSGVFRQFRWAADVKTWKAMPVSPGMRSRVNEDCPQEDNGREVLAEAVKSGGR